MVKTHSDFRSKVCCICWRRSDRIMKPNEIVLVRAHGILDYDVTNPSFPSGLCGSCRIKLSSQTTANQKSLIVSIHHKISYRRVSPRITTSCECIICKIGKMNGLQAKNLKLKPGRPSLSSCKTIKKCMKVCSNCKSIVYPGCKHSKSDCRSQRITVTNIRKYFLENEKMTQQVISKILTEMSTHNNNNNNLVLRTFGKSLKISLGSTNESDKASLLTEEEVNFIKLDSRLSDRQLLRVLRSIRLKWGRRCIEKDIKKKIVHRKTIFDDIFSLAKTNFLNSDKTIERYFVFCNDIQEFIQRVCDYRGNHFTQTENQIGFDLGKDFLKLTLSIGVKDARDIQYDPGHNRISRGDGLVSKKQFRISGVNKIFIIACAQNVPENYENCSIFIKRTQIENISYTFSTDCKMTNILAGLGPHSSKHPCVYCNGTFGIWEEDADTRTIQNILDNNEKWISSGRKKTELKTFYNCSNVPLFSMHMDKSTPMLQLFPPPALHLKLGIVNKIISIMIEEYPLLEEWLHDQLFIMREDYHGKQFEGNECNKILKNLILMREFIPPNLLFHWNCLYDFKLVYDSCFGLILAQDYKECISLLSKSIEHIVIKFKFSITPKIHIILRHVPEFIAVTGMPLGVFSEQSIESSHSIFLNFFNKYKLKDHDRPQFGTNFLKSIHDFNSTHL